jgi:hypothetical protein
MKTLKDFQPTTLDQAVTALMQLDFQDAKKVALTHTADSFVAFTHFTLGRHLRNTWGLWQASSELKNWFIRNTDLNHPDDMSGLILETYYHKLIEL